MLNTSKWKIVLLNCFFRDSFFYSFFDTIDSLWCQQQISSSVLRAGCWRREEWDGRSNRNFTFAGFETPVSKVEQSRNPLQFSTVLSLPQYQPTLDLGQLSFHLKSPMQSVSKIRYSRWNNMVNNIVSELSKVPKTISNLIWFQEMITFDSMQFREADSSLSLSQFHCLNTFRLPQELPLI